ncbi:hypothetical protein EDB92DRAFT_474949 [Lactarius akahatsu]|uniref:Uncharacterized protein n=1 Tax=Lactarius akahatsu TaxID=416441 RepID=A0AAD4LQP7_9AGAM|nr:hypothetical protein EDB92DRAFT_474949 [Lactarius akahatsu]
MSCFLANLQYRGLLKSFRVYLGAILSFVPVRASIFDPEAAVAPSREAAESRLLPPHTLLNLSKYECIFICCPTTHCSSSVPRTKTGNNTYAIVCLSRLLSRCMDLM